MTVYMVGCDSHDRSLLRDALQDLVMINELETGKNIFSSFDAQNPPVAIIMNMAMQDSLETVRELQEDLLFRTVPVFALVDSGDNQAMLSAFDAGATQIFTRPLDRDIVKSIADIYLKRHNKFLHENEIDKKTNIYTKEQFCQRTKKILIDNPDNDYVLVRWDIDRFKVLNDTFGTDTGDKVLKHIGDTLRKFSNVFASYGHWNADNFVFCMEKSLFNANELHKELTTEISEFFRAFKFTLRFGVFEIEDHTLDVTLMSDRALLALRSQKDRADSFCGYYTKAMRDALIEEQELTAEMNGALESGQFKVYLQPQYDFAQNKMFAAEALVRWIHPEKGIISPAKFIPLFEKNGFITRLDEYIWEQVCILLRHLLNRGLPIVPIGINISRRDVDDIPWLINVLTGLISAYKLKPSYLHIEITESAYMDNPDELINVVTALHKNGFQVQMDDFGSGYSSLNMLKDVFVDTIKLDMKFISGSENVARSGIILSYLIRMAHWMKMTVIAEGVETKEQASYLRSIGCMYMQGYFFAKPMPILDFEKLLLRNNGLAITGSRHLSNLGASARFFDASEQASILFNRFVGGAAILEVTANNIEALRMNNFFFAELGVTREEYIPYQQHLLDTIADEDKQLMLDSLDSAAKTGDDVIVKIRLKALADKTKGDKVRMRLLLLAADDESKIFFCTIDNISAWTSSKVRRSGRDILSAGGDYPRWQKTRSRFHRDSKNAITFEYDADIDVMSIMMPVPRKGLTEKVYYSYLASISKNTYVDKEYRDAVLLAFRNACNSLDGGTFDCHAEFYSGKPHWYRVVHQSIADDHDQVFRVVGHFEEIDTDDYGKPYAVARKTKTSRFLQKENAIEEMKYVIRNRPPKRLDAMLLISVDNYSELSKRNDENEMKRIAKSVEKELTSFVRIGDIAGKFGSGEFVVYIKSVGGIDLAMRTASSINERVSTVKEANGNSLHCSVGISRVFGKRDSFDVLFDRADNALAYTVKHGGGSFALYTEDAMREM